MAQKNAPEWVVYARLLVALGKREYVAKVQAACPDLELRKLLFSLDSGYILPYEYQDLTKKLREEARDMEATVVEMLAWRDFAVQAERPSILEPDVREAVLKVCNHFAHECRKYDFTECEAFFSSTLGAGAADLLDWAKAEFLLRHAICLYEKLAGENPELFLAECGITYDNLGISLQQQRRFLESFDAHSQALVIRTDLANTNESGPRFALSTTLNNLGNALAELHSPSAAREVYQKSLAIRQELAKSEPSTYRPYVASVLTNIGTVWLKEENFHQAREAYHQALDTYRKLSEHEPQMYQMSLVRALNNLGIVLEHMHDLCEARRHYEDAAQLSRESTTMELHSSKFFLAISLNNLANALAKQGADNDAFQASYEAVKAAETSSNDVEQIWLAKGVAIKAYGRILTHYVLDGDIDKAFRCLAAMRDGSACALDTHTEVGLEATADALSTVEKKTGRSFRVLVVQGIGQKGVMVGVLRSHKPYLRCVRADDFGACAHSLAEHLVKAMVSECSEDSVGYSEAVIHWSMAAWETLPQFVRETVHPGKSHSLLISGDAFWTRFPWEAIRFDKRDDGLLGLERPLVRWASIDQESILRISNRAFGSGDKTAAVICPWNALKEKPLTNALEEARTVAEKLSGLGYEPIPQGKSLLRENVRAVELAEVLLGSPAIIHYNGHGHVFGTEETLVLNNNFVGGAPMYFGRQEIILLKKTVHARRQLLTGDPLIILNSCWTGGTRDFGGQREDIAWLLLREGAAAVIGSPLPVLDELGRDFGTSLYDIKRKGETMPQTFVRARRNLRERCQSCGPSRRLAWALLHYHGNPCATLPHAQ